MWIAPRGWVTSGRWRRAKRRRWRRVEGWKSRRPANSAQCLARSIQPHRRSLSPRASQHARGAALLGAALGVAVRRLQPAQSRRRNVALVTPTTRIPQCDRAWRGCDGRCCDGRQSGRFSWSWSGRRRRRTGWPACEKIQSRRGNVDQCAYVDVGSRVGDSVGTEVGVDVGAGVGLHAQNACRSRAHTIR